MFGQDTSEALFGEGVLPPPELAVPGAVVDGEVAGPPSTWASKRAKSN